MTQAANADTVAASAVASALEQSLESGFLPEDENYRKTGNFAEEPDKKDETEGQEPEEKNAVTEDAPAATTEENADTAAVPAAATPQETQETGKTPEKSENRYRKLSKENRELKEKIARLEGREEGRTQAAPRETEQTSQPATETPGRPQIEDVDPKTGQPKYATYADYENARDEWIQNEAVRKFQESSARDQQKRAIEQAEATIGKEMAKKFDTARTRYKDFDQVALNEDMVIPRGSVTDIFLIDSDHAADVLYHLGQHPEILGGFYSDYDLKTGRFLNKMSPQRQFRKLMEIEAEVSKPAPVRKITQASPPPHQVDGRNAVTKSARDQALEDQDSETYIRDSNASDPRLAAVRASRKKG